MMTSLKGKRCLVVGGGKVAERKISSLLDTGADIWVVSPACSSRIEEWANNGSLTLHRRRFHPEDVKGAALLIAATDDPSVNLSVYQAMEPWQWINIADRPDLCTFFVPSTLERGSLQIAVSTGGNNPGLAKKLRSQLEAWVGQEYGDYLSFLGGMRAKVLGLPLNEERKRKLLEQLLDDRFLQMTMEGRIEARNREAERLFSET
ncbi:precorrin-2 dehydrogenase/sirohydrochlorin ferrochelatase family protein [Brevibacillus sp. H7]|uniref:precorrin-2 dehydrogenase/sirohydrochlorin ferrochelatase family protein n=1 Tax=Brevibacillus sp. H7 TaxID=3349138 RepID=UPI0037FD1D2E